MALTTEEILRMEQSPKQKGLTTEELLAMASPEEKKQFDLGGIAKEAISYFNPIQKAYESKMLQDPQKQRETLQGIGGVAYEIPNQLAMGYLSPTLSKLNIPIPQTTTAQKLVAGSLTTPLAMGMVSKISKLPKVIQAIAPTIMGYAYNPDEKEFTATESPKRLIGAGIGLAGQTVGNIAEVIGNTINPSAVESLFKGLKPSKWNLKFKNDANIALPIIKNTGVEVNTVDDFITASKTAKESLWGKIKDMLDIGEKNMTVGTKQITKMEPLTNTELLGPQGQKLKDILVPKQHDIRVVNNGIQGNEVINSIENAIPNEREALSQEINDAIRGVYNKYKNKTFTMNEVEDRLQVLNSGLTNYFKSPARGQNIKQDQEMTAALLAEKSALRNIQEKYINSLSGKELAPLKKQYGALMNVQDEALGRINVGTRQAPISLQEAIHGVWGTTELLSGNPLGVIRIIASMTAKKLNSMDRLVSRAVKTTGTTPVDFSKLGKLGGILASRSYYNKPNR